MRKTSKAVAALVLSMGLMACSGNAASTSAAADSASASATASTSAAADSTSVAASAADSTSAAASSSSGSASTAATDVYTNTELGISYTPLAGYAYEESKSGNAEFNAVNERGDSVNLTVSDIGSQNISDPAVFKEIEQVFTDSVSAEGVEGASITTGEFTLGSGETYPSILASGTLNGTALDIKQVYVQIGSKLCIFTATDSTGTNIDNMLLGISLL